MGNAENVERLRLTSSPGKTNSSIKETLKHQREDDTTHCSSCCRHSSCCASLNVKEVTDGRDGWSENKGCSGAAENAEHDDEVPVLGTDPQQEYAQHQKHRAAHQKVARSVHIEYWTYDESSAEGEEDVDADNPTDGGLTVCGKLVFLPVRLKDISICSHRESKLSVLTLVDTDGIHQSKSGNQTTERSKDDEPGTQTALGVECTIWGHTCTGFGTAQLGSPTVYIL